MSTFVLGTMDPHPQSDESITLTLTTTIHDQYHHYNDHHHRSYNGMNADEHVTNDDDSHLDDDEPPLLHHERHPEAHKDDRRHRTDRTRRNDSHGTSTVTLLLLLLLLLLSLPMMLVQAAPVSTTDTIVSEDTSSSWTTTTPPSSSQNHDGSSSSSSTTATTAASSPHRTIVEHLWQKFQEVTTTHSHPPPNMKDQTVKVSNGEQAPNGLLTPLQQEWIQQLLQQQQQQQQLQGNVAREGASTVTAIHLDDLTTAAAAAAEQLKQQQQQQQQQQQRHSIATKGHQRRQALYQYTTQQHYASYYLRNVVQYNTDNHNHSNSNDLHQPPQSTNTWHHTEEIINNDKEEEEETAQKIQERLLYNTTLWNMVSQAFYAYTHTSHQHRHRADADSETTNQHHPPNKPTTTTSNNKATNDVKIDRTSFLFDGLAPYPQSRRLYNQQLIQEMFRHGYDAYMYHAFPDYGEICPISCVPCTFDLVRIPALTLMDSLDTLLVLDNTTEFARSVERLRLLHTTSTTASSIFAIDQNVSVFETNIRVLGGLLSAHQLALALQLDQYPQHRTGHSTMETRTKKHEPNTILLYDVFENHENDDTNHLNANDINVQVRYGRIDPTTSPQERWWHYQKTHQPDPKYVVDASRLPSEVCDTTFDATSTMTNRMSPITTVSPCYDSNCPLLPPTSSSRIPLPNCPRLPFTKIPYTSSSSVGSAAWTTTTCPINHTSAATSSSTTPTTATSSSSTTTTTIHIPEADLWIYDGFLLELALDIGQRLLPAFSTPTGIPYGTVNLLYGVPHGETTVASLAGGGTLSIEFELLSRLTGDTRFGRAAKLASRALFRHRSKLDLFGKHIDIRSGAWVETLSGIGSNSDSFLEYLAKHYMLFPEDDDFWIMFKVAYAGVFNESRVGEWYADVDMNYGVSSGQSRRVFESLAAFYPGLQVLLGELAPAARSLNSMSMVREILGFLPERFNYGIWNLDHNRDGAGIHPLRPELLESNYLMHRATRGVSATPSNRTNDTVAQVPTSGWQWAADYALHKLATVTQARCGFAGIREVKPQTTGALDNGNNGGIVYIDEMPSFFLSETLKYLYLTFDDDNILHQDSDREWIFTTEAHPVHYVPQISTSSANVSARRELTRNVDAIKASLRRRLHSFENGASNNASLLTKYDNSYFRGRWTKVINNVSYREDINSVIMKKSLHRQEDSTNHVTQFVPAGHFLQDVFRESERKCNVANLALGNWGSGMRLQKNCLNIYRSDFLWIQALSGGATDYSDSYVSTGYDTLLDEPHYFNMFGAADAIGSLGVGVYVGEKDMEGDTCPISISTAEPVPLVIDPTSTENNTSTTIASEVGNFEISTDPGGAGFYVRHVDNEEMIKATVIASENPSGRPMAIVHSELCTKNWILQTGSDIDGGFQVAREKQRRSSIADFDGNSFSCEIKLLRTDNTDTEGSDSSKESILAVVPCTPAAFGPTQMSQLKEQGAITIDAKLIGPHEDNLWGCNIPKATTFAPTEDLLPPLQVSENIGIEENEAVVIDVDTHSWEANSIHMVHRGECNFFDKAVNMYKTWNVDAIIVVNSSDEMFMMSTSAEDMGNIDPIEIPISVLISKQDGAVLFNQINSDNSIHSRPFLTRIEILRSFSPEDIETNQIHWPIIRGTNNVLEIMAEFGWGIHAEHKTEGEYQEWQLSILKHSVGENK